MVRASSVTGSGHRYETERRQVVASPTPSVDDRALPSREARRGLLRLVARERDAPWFSQQFAEHVELEEREVFGFVENEVRHQRAPSSARQALRKSTMGRSSTSMVPASSSGVPSQMAPPVDGLLALGER